MIMNNTVMILKTRELAQEKLRTDVKSFFDFPTISPPQTSGGRSHHPSGGAAAPIEVILNVFSRAVPGM